MEKNLEQLNELAQEYEFSGAHNAITCANIYRDSYSEYFEKYNNIKDVLLSIKGILSDDMGKLIDEKLKENNITI